MSELAQLFAEKAAPLAMQVHEAASWSEALAHAVRICREKAPCENLMPGPDEAYGSTLTERTLAAPGLPPVWLERLHALCAEAGITCVTENLRAHAAGLDVGLAVAVAAVAETATCVVPSGDENVRLATMLCESGVLLVAASTLVRGLGDTLSVLRAEFGVSTGAAQANYMAYITGSSRTADIERVLALGAHGPLELHVIIWNDGEIAA